MKIIISPYSRGMRNGNKNPKDYPYWDEVIRGLVDAGHEVTQVGAGNEKKLGVEESGISGYHLSWKFDLPLKELKARLLECDLWISVDNFFQHFAHLHKKPGIVIFSRSNPKIFGHSTNVNLLKDEKYLREKPFDIWEACDYNPDAYVDPSVVLKAVSDWRAQHV